jgi:mismatch-specific thymine-DNA glycosylase
MNYQTTSIVDGHRVQTLADILPATGPMKMLIIAKTPAPVSVAAGHYFQGRQGQMFWNRLQDYGLLSVPPDTYPDEVLLDHGYGLTDVVKVPREYGMEPSDREYRAGLDRILGLMSNLQPRVTMFVYKGVLDQILKLPYGQKKKSVYGFNQALEGIFKCKVFAFPMPGTPCTAEQARRAMLDLQATLGD